ncbi:glutamate-cysteine ligase-domain-containing protein [Schizophyllum commune]
MGLLALGTPLEWEEAKKYADHVRYHGITQFLNTWDRYKDRCGDKLLWGDEIEYMVVSFDDEKKAAHLSLRQSEILEKLSAIVDDISTETENRWDFFNYLKKFVGLPSAPAPRRIPVPTFHPEYGRYMLESTPGAPYTGSIADLLSVEANMRYRRTLARKHLKDNEYPLTFTSFPRLGAPGQFTDPYYPPEDAVSSHSFFLPEEITNPHARFPTLTANIRRRRGSKVAINLPIYPDENTPKPFVDPTIPWDRQLFPEDSNAKDGAALVDHIYLDAMGFGMGCCCLQLTFQACNVNDARRLYDCLIPAGPILLALTAGSPLYRGYIADVDCRWNVIAGSVDDRTEEERGLKPLKNDRFVIPKSRYDSVDLYIANDRNNRPEYNDTYAPYDEAIFNRVRDHGIDDLLAKHIAHLFIRDPLVVFSETIDQDDENSNDHFENIQSTNWQTMRFKPPPVNSSIGWRVEFRSMEVQLTDFENAAFALFIVLLSRALLQFDVNMYMPISKVDENMQRAQLRNAAAAQKFFFRKDIFPPGHSPMSSGASSPVDSEPRRRERQLRNCFARAPVPENGVPQRPVEEEYEEMTMKEVMNGKGDTFPGLIGLVDLYLDTLHIEHDEMTRIQNYLDLIRQRSTGQLKTPATWIREFVLNHPKYKKDSVVSEEINYDLMRAVDEIERGVRAAPDLLPKGYKGGKDDGGNLI